MPNTYENSIPIPSLILEISNANFSFWKYLVCTFESIWAFLSIPNMFASNGCFYAYKKSISTHNSFWRYWASMNSVTWLVKSIPRCAWSHLIEIFEIVAVSLDIYQKTFKADLSFWITLGMPSCTRPSPIDYFYGCLSTQKKLYASTLLWYNGISGILQSDWSRGSLTIKQNLRTLPDMVIGMGSQVS